MNPCFL
jgi:hypothetical protein